MSEEQKKDKKLSVMIKALSSKHEINIKFESTLEELSTDVDNAIQKLAKSKTITLKEISQKEKEVSSKNQPIEEESNPVTQFANRLELDEKKFNDLKLVAIKGGDIQILIPTKLGLMENTLLLLALSEYGVSRPSLPYEEWKELFVSSNLKSKSPYHKIINNGVNAKYIDKKKYNENKELVLTGKGVEEIKKALNDIIK